MTRSHDFELTPAVDDVERVAGLFGLGEPSGAPVLAARGANGHVWRLETDRGVYAVKQLQPWIAEEPHPFDMKVQRAAIAAGIPMPAPVVTPDGRAMVDRVRVYEWMDLAAPWDEPVGGDLAHEIGSMLGRIHRLGVAPKDPVAGWFTTAPTHDEWRDVARQSAAAGVPWAEEMASEVDFLAELGASLRFPSGALVTCHRDFVPSNVLPSSDSGRPVVLDWENVGPLTAAAELAWVLVWWTTDDTRTDTDAVAALVDGYGSAPTIDRGSFGPVLTTHLNYLKVSADNAINGGEHAEFAAGALERLWPARLRLRLAAIDEILTVLGR